MMQTCDYKYHGFFYSIIYALITFVSKMEINVFKGVQMLLPFCLWKQLIQAKASSFLWNNVFGCQAVNGLISRV